MSTLKCQRGSPRPPRRNQSHSADRAAVFSWRTCLHPNESSVVVHRHNLAVVLFEGRLHALEHRPAQFEVLRDVGILVALVHLRADDELDAVVGEEAFEDLARREGLSDRALLLLQRLADVREREDALRAEADARQDAARGEAARVAHGGEVDLHAAAQLALQDVRRRAAADDDVVLAQVRLAGEFGVVLLVVGRTGEDAQHARMAEVDDEAADVVLAELGGDVLRETGDAAGEVGGGDVGLARDHPLGEREHAAAAPAELVGDEAGAEAALRHAVRTEDDAVARLHVHVHLAHLAVGPVRRDDGAVLGGRNLLRAAQVDVGGVAHLDDARASAQVVVEEGEGSVADLPHLADRQRVHDDLHGLQQVEVRLHEPKRHRRRHVREDERLHAGSKAVRQRGERPVLLLDRQELHVVATGGLPRLRELGGLHFEEEVVRQLKPPLFMRPWLSAWVCAL